MLKWLFGSNTDSKVPQILAPGNVGYLSASCCNPAAGPVDEKLLQNLDQAMKNLDLDLEVHKETLTGAQAAMFSTMGQLNMKQNKVVTKVMSLFSSRGLEAFPALFINGDLAFYGGVPSTEEIEKHLRENLSQLQGNAPETDVEAQVGS